MTIYSRQEENSKRRKIHHSLERIATNFDVTVFKMFIVMLQPNKQIYL